MKDKQELIQLLSILFGFSEDAINQMTVEGVLGMIAQEHYFMKGKLDILEGGSAADSAYEFNGSVFVKKEEE